MRRRDFYLLLPTGIALIAAVALELHLGGYGPAPNPPQKPVFPGLADRIEELAWVRIARGTAKVDFANVAGRWVAVDKDNYPADPARLQQLFRELADLTLVEPNKPDTKRSAGIDRDGAARGTPTLIALRGRTGDTVAEAIVATAPAATAPGGTDMLYIRKPGVELAFLARGSLELPDDLLGWLDRSIVDLPEGRVATLTLTGPDGATLAMRRDRPDAAFVLADLPPGMQLKQGARLSELADALAGLAFADVKPLALIELPQRGVARAEFVTFDGLTVDLRLFAQEGAEWAAVAASGTGPAEAESDAINAKVARWVYTIPAARAKLLRTSLNELTEPAKGIVNAR